MCYKMLLNFLWTIFSWLVQGHEVLVGKSDKQYQSALVWKDASTDDRQRQPGGLRVSREETMSLVEVMITPPDTAESNRI